jgi:uncharacterized membrane protein
MSGPVGRSHQGRLKTHLESEEPPEPGGRSVGARLLGSALVTVVALFVLFTPWPVPAKLRAIGHACCAQIPTHTLTLAGQAMPLDARNSGIYGAVLVVIAMTWLLGRRRAGQFVSPRLGFLLMLAVLAMVFDGFNSLAETHHLRTLYHDTNVLRVVTGALAGMALTILTLPLFNRLVWREPEEVAIADDVTDLVGYLAGITVLALALLGGAGILYYPLSMLAAGGVLVTVTFVNTCICLVSARRENTVGTLTDLALPALAGLVLTCLEIASIDLWKALHP